MPGSIKIAKRGLYHTLELNHTELLELTTIGCCEAVLASLCGVWIMLHNSN